MTKIRYNGTMVEEAWARKIEQSQSQPFYNSDGIRYPRIRYGDENPRWGDSPCSNCAVVRGQFHVTDECEFEKCPKCGQSMGGHTCSFDEYADRTPDSVQKPILSRELKIVLFFLLLLTILFALRIFGVFR
jgi:PHP family Zn ribbon phosphoesterase